LDQTARLAVFALGLAFALLFTLGTAQAQLSGSYTIGTGQTYTSLVAFANALNSLGVSGPVTATVLPDTYTGAVSFNQITGASATNTITIQGQNVNTCIIEYNTAATNSYVLRLYGTDYIRIRDLTINATGTTYGYGVWLTNQADYNEITGCKINVSNTTTTGYCVGILISGTSSYSSYGNNANYNLFEGNEVKGGYYGVSARGSSSTVNCVGNDFIDNSITDFYYYGMYMYYMGGYEVSGNTIIEELRQNQYSYGMYCYYNSNAPEITANYIRAGYASIMFYYGNQSQTSRGRIDNNMLIVWNTSYYNYGMYCYYSYDMDVVYNSINCMSSYYCYGFYAYAYSGSNHVFKNNVMANTGGATTFYTFFMNGTTNYYDAWDYNVYYHPSANYTFYNNGYYYSLSSLQSAFSGLYQHDITVDPEFIDDFDLHTYSFPLNGSGSPVTGITTDFDGDTRHATAPDRGCDEFTLYALDAGAKTLTAPVEGCGLGAGSTLAIGIRNYGSSTINMASTPVTVYVTVTGPIPQNFSTTLTSGTIAPGATGSFTITNSLNLSVAGLYTFNAYTVMTGDGNTSNDAMKPQSIFVDKTVASWPYMENFEANNGYWRGVSLGGANDWEWGQPNYTGTYAITSANSGNNAWMTGLTTMYSNGAYAALQSPCLNMATLMAPVFQFYANFASESGFDGWYAEGSTNGGATWSKLTPLYPAYNYTYSYGPQSAPQYSYISMNSWQKYVFILPSSYAMNPNVKLRITFGSDASVNTYPGVAIDDIAIGDFPQSDIAVTDVVYDNATNYWARRQNANHVIHARIVNNGYEANPKTVPVTYKAGGLPGSQFDGVNESFNPSWSGGEAWITFTTQHMPMSPGALNMYVRSFYSSDQNSGNDWAMTTPVIQPENVYGYEDFNTLTPPNWEKLWTVEDVNDDDVTWMTEAGAGMGGSTAASYPGDMNEDADDWLFTPGAYLLAGSSYSLDFYYRSRDGSPQILDVAWGTSPDPASMTVFASYGNFQNTSFLQGLGQYGVAPFFNTPNVAQMYYIGFHVRSAKGSGALDLDDIVLYDNPFPPPKIAYGVDPIFIDDPTIPITFTGVYKKTGLLFRTYEVRSSTDWYGNPEGDMLWMVTTPANWIDIFMPTPDPLTFLAANPYSPPWARQRQSFTMQVNASVLPPGNHQSTVDFDAYLYNAVYPRGIRASNAIFSVPVEMRLSAAGGAGLPPGPSTQTQTAMTSAGNPWVFMDQFGNVFAEVMVMSGAIPTMTINSFPGQLPMHVSRYRYVDHYWTIDAEGTGWVADIAFHYFDSEVLSGGVLDEDALRGMRIAPGTGFWEDPIMGTMSSPASFYNFVAVRGFTPSNIEGEIALAHDWELKMEGKQGAGIPASYSLDQNYPNPFNPTTEIKFAVPSEQHVSLVVMNSLGEEVARLVDKVLPAGYHTVTFDGEGLTSGLYLYTLKSGEFVKTRTMVLAK
jgi:hypothetical protein